MNSISYEDAAKFGDPVALGEDKIPTGEGMKTVPEIMDRLMWGSYSANRDYGCAHELLAKNGIGNEAMKARYEAEQKERENFRQRAEALKNRLNPTV